MISEVRLCLIAFGLLTVCGLSPLTGDNPKDQKNRDQTEESKDQPPEDPDDVFELSDDVKEILSPLFVAIKEAKVSRATIDVISDSLITGKVIESKKSTYQIASKSPDKFTIYLKEPSQRTRIYNDGESVVVALAPDAYFNLPEPITNSDAMIGLPIPMGAYPEPILALTLAGVDPATSMISGMKSIELIDDRKFRGKIPAVHLHGVQADTVTWDLWLATGKTPKPLRLLVDLTPMLLASSELRLPRGYSHQLRFDFLSWRVTGKVDDSLFAFKPAKDAKEYKSIADYRQAMAVAAALPPLLGKKMPDFETVTMDNDNVTAKDFEGKVIVIDFWTSWHEPCAEILPAIKQVCDDFADKDVVFLAMNVGEEDKEIQPFLKKLKLTAPFLKDPDGSIAEAFKVQAVPQTVIVGKNGYVESVHLGYPGKEALIRRLTDELEVLSIGGLIATVSEEQETEKAESSASSPATKETKQPKPNAARSRGSDQVN